jgi:uncharacterized coiled-coil protein SlyX
MDIETLEARVRALETRVQTQETILDIVFRRYATFDKRNDTVGEILNASKDAKRAGNAELSAALYDFAANKA